MPSKINEQEILIHKKTLEKLKKTLNAQLVSFEGFFKQGILLNFINNYKVLITPFQSEYKQVMNGKGLKVIHDKDFYYLRKFLNKEEFNPSSEDGSLFLKQILEAFSKNLKKDKLINYYEKLYDFELKSLFSEFYKLGLDPKKEVFLFGNDEARPRFKEGSELKLTTKGIPVKIYDSSALLITNQKGEVYLDMHTHGYKTEDKIYLNKIYTYQDCLESECDIIEMGPNHEKKYKKMVLTPGTDLTKEPYLHYKNANGLKMLLKQEDGEYYFIYQNKKIPTYHHDLLIYVL